MSLIDSHCHIDDERFDHDRDQVLQRAEKAGVTAQIVPAIQSCWWPRLKQVCDKHPGLYPSYGLHPMFICQHREQDIVELTRWLEREPAVAVGECGLDFYIPEPHKERQYYYLEAQLELARRFDLPVIIHARRAVEEVIRLLKRHPGVRGVFHSYSGSLQQAHQLIDLGFMLGFGGPITYPRAKRLRQLVKQLPLESILIETDSPDQPDQLHHNSRNEPRHLKTIALTISQLRSISYDQVEFETAANADRLFQFSRFPASTAD